MECACVDGDIMSCAGNAIELEAHEVDTVGQHRPTQSIITAITTTTTTTTTTAAAAAAAQAAAMLMVMMIIISIYVTCVCARECSAAGQAVKT